jgi:hypothetical protein
MPEETGESMELEFEEVDYKALKKYDIVYIRAYNAEAIGAIIDIDKWGAVIKIGFGRKTNFVVWWQDNPKLFRPCKPLTDLDHDEQCEGSMCGCARRRKVE